MNELLGLSERFESNLLDGWTIEFYSGPHAYAHFKRKILQYPAPDFFQFYMGPYAQWDQYWSTVVHELAHAVDYEWFSGGPGGSHSWTFYAILLALSMHIDLPFNSYEKYENSYHPLRWKQGKNLAGELIMDRLRAISVGEYTCDDRQVYDTTYCSWIDTQCIVHSVPSGQLTLGL